MALDSQEDLEGAAEAGLKTLALNKEKAPLLERLQHALLEAAADELIRTNGEVVAVLSRISAKPAGLHQSTFSLMNGCDV